MSSVLRSVSRRKQGRTLGPVEIIRREDHADLELDAKVELIRSLVPLGLMHVEELLDAEVTALAGGHYARKDASVWGAPSWQQPRGRSGWPASACRFACPRIRHVAGSEIPLRSYEALHGDRAVNDVLLKRVLYGISCRNYEAAAEAIPGAIGAVGVDGVPGLYSGQRGEAAGTPGAGPLRRGRRWLWSWTARPSPRRRWSAHWASQ